MPNSNNKMLTIAGVKELGQCLITVADKYPTIFLTERDFFPLIHAYLRGRVPRTTSEAYSRLGRIDFRVGGTNPVVLELAVAPRRLQDPKVKSLPFPGHELGNNLYASQNRSELRKLSEVPYSKAKYRYLLLLDLRDAHDLSELETGYRNETRGLPPNYITVVYVSRQRVHHFTPNRPKRRRRRRNP